VLAAQAEVAAALAAVEAEGNAPEERLAAAKVRG